MKDLFLITSYTPDTERKDILRKLVDSINKDKFDVMVVSHSPIPSDVIEKVNYFIYDSNNILLTKPEHSYTMFFNSEDFTIQSTENRPFNHFLAALKLVTLGLSTAKNEGYSKVHSIEYDTELKSDTEYIENSKLLEEHSLVFYTTPYPPYMFSSTISFNLNKINKEWFEFNIDNLMDWVENDSSKCLEQYENNLIEKETNSYKKDRTQLEDNGANINIYYSGGNDVWAVPVINPDNELILFSWNKSTNYEQLKDLDNLNVQVIVNNTSYHNWDLSLNAWKLSSMGNFRDINYITIIKNKKDVLNYDFTQMDKDIFKKYNFVTPNG